MSLLEIIDGIVKVTHEQSAASVFLNLCPGAGKDYLLQTLAQALPERLAGCILLGPIRLASFDPAEAAQTILAGLDDQYHLNSPPPDRSDGGLLQAWQWAAENGDLSARHTVVVLFDLPYGGAQDTATLARLFSQARSFEARNPGPARVCHVFAGEWDHPSLLAHYDQISVSPINPEAYRVWFGLSEDEVQAWAGQQTRPPLADLHLRLLYELTAGHLAVIEECWALLKPNQPVTFVALLERVRQAAERGAAAQELVARWKNLPDDSKAGLEPLLLQRYIRAPLLLPPVLERLRLAGLVKEYRAQGQSYLGFRSWFVQLAARLHLDAIGLASVPVQQVPLQDLMPATVEMNLQAYRLIHQIENMARNFVVATLWQNSAPGGPHPLSGKVRRSSGFEGRNEDALERIENWRYHNERRGVSSTAANPTIAYLSTNDLSILVKETAAQIDSPEWEQIGDMIQQLTGVRDAVMHNQLIDDKELEKLYTLQARVLAVLSQ